MKRVFYENGTVFSLSVWWSPNSRAPLSTVTDRSKEKKTPCKESAIWDYEVWASEQTVPSNVVMQAKGKVAKSRGKQKGSPRPPSNSAKSFRRLTLKAIGQTVTSTGSATQVTSDDIIEVIECYKDIRRLHVFDEGDRAALSHCPRAACVGWLS